MLHNYSQILDIHIEIAFGDINSSNSLPLNKIYYSSLSEQDFLLINLLIILSLYLAYIAQHSEANILVSN